MEHRLSAILAADVVGYSRLMEQDEAGTFERLLEHREHLFEPEIDRHRGRVFKQMGDGLLAEFSSVADSVMCAIAIQHDLARRNAGLKNSHRFDMRMGVNLGDVIVEGEDRYGEVVNIAARLQTLADPGGITVSRTVAEHVGQKLAVKFEDLGERHVKNIVEPVHIYKVRPEWLSERPVEAPGKLPSLPALMAMLTGDSQFGDVDQEWLGKIARRGILTRLSGATWILAIGLPQRLPSDDNLTFGGA